MGGSEQLFTVERIENGWVVLIHQRYFSAPRHVFCPTFEEVEKVARNAAFPYPNKSQARGPTPP